MHAREELFYIEIQFSVLRLYEQQQRTELRRLLRKIKQRLGKVSFPVLLSENRFIKRNI